jgi:hypothetical protein
VDTIANTGTDAIVRFDGYNNTINDVRYFYTASLYNESVNLYTSDDTESRGSVTFNRAMASTERRYSGWQYASYR